MLDQRVIICLNLFNYGTGRHFYSVESLQGEILASILHLLPSLSRVAEGALCLLYRLHANFGSNKLVFFYTRTFKSSTLIVFCKDMNHYLLDRYRYFKCSVADPEWFISDPALNFPSSGSRQKLRTRIQPILTEIIKKTLNSIKKKNLTSICESLFYTTE